MEEKFNSINFIKDGSLIQSINLITIYSSYLKYFYVANT